jgi:ATP/ADP translocase
MKYLAILAICFVAYYMTMNKIVMTQINAMKDLYSNIDTYTSQIAKNPGTDLTPPQALKTMSNPTSYLQSR